MANTRTLTSSNSIIAIAVVGLFDVPQRLKGFSADNITDIDAVQPTETSVGLDGRLSAGFVPVSRRQTITLQADSESNDFFERWLATEETTRDKYVASGLLILPAVQRKYAMTRGFLYSVPPIPGVARTLQARRYTIEWQSVSPAPF